MRYKRYRYIVLYVKYVHNEQITNIHNASAFEPLKDGRLVLSLLLCCHISTVLLVLIVSNQIHFFPAKIISLMFHRCHLIPVDPQQLLVVSMRMYHAVSRSIRRHHAVAASPTLATNTCPHTAPRLN